MIEEEGLWGPLRKNPLGRRTGNYPLLERVCLESKSMSTEKRTEYIEELLPKHFVVDVYHYSDSLGSTHEYADHAPRQIW